MIRVGVNLMWLRPGEVGGSEQYLVRILDALGRRPESGFELKLYVLPEFADAHPDLVKQFSTSAAPIKNATPARRVLCEQRWLPARLGRDGIDVAFHPGGTMPLRPGPRPVLLVHDIQYLDYPQHFSKVKLRYLAAQVPRSVRRACVLTAPSRFTLDRLGEAFGIGAESTVVIPHGIDARRQVAEPFVVDRPVILYPAITYPHKNHITLLKAVAGLVEPVKLVLTGGQAGAEADIERSIAELGLSDTVDRLGRVNGADLERWWATAAVLAWPSKYEGFGAPLLEAMVHGVPIVASDRTAVPEVVGDAGMLVDAHDVTQWTSALSAALGPENAERLRDLGQQRARSFTADRAVDAFLSAVELAYRT